MSEQIIVFAAHHKREPCHIGEHYSIAILPIEARASCVKRSTLRRRQIPMNGGKPLAQFLPISSIPTVPETAEPTFSYAPEQPLCVSERLAPACVPRSARSTDLI